MKYSKRSRESCKRHLDLDDDWKSPTKRSPTKKRKICESEHAVKNIRSPSKPVSPRKSSRLSNNTAKDAEKVIPSDKKSLNKKEKENEFTKKIKVLPQKCSKSPNEVLKSAKINSNCSYSNVFSSDSDTSCEIEEKNDILTTPKSRRSKRSRKVYDRQCKSVDYVNKSVHRKIQDSYGQKTPSSKVPSTPTTPLEKARISLHVSAIPESLPCREREFSNIFSFLENKLLDGIGGCMYISGVPGTGKTATVTQVIRKLKSLASEGKVPDFKFIEINGMRLSDPRQAYNLLWQGLSGKNEKLSSEQAQRKLDAWFGKNDSKDIKMPTVLLVDELDLICTRKQDVVYNILDWPTKSPSRLIVLTIANTMDMPERLFKGRVTSRMGLTRLTFLPYTFKQLEDIILTRLNGLNAFSLDAVRLVTRKVAAVSGDARRSLDICRRATELPAEDETVKISHIEQAIREMTNSNSVKVIRSCSDLEKLFLRAVSEVSTRTGVEEVDMRDVIEHFLALCTLEGHSRLPVSHILHISNRLKCFRLLFTNQSQNGILQRLTLNVTQDDIHYGIKCDS